MTIGEKISQAMQEKGISYRDLEQATGIAKSALQRYVTGQTSKIPLDRLELIAKALNVPAAYLMGWDDHPMKPRKKGVKIPVLGDVAAGIPIEAIEDIVDYEEIDEDMARGGDYFGLRIKGDSMEPRMVTGDVVIVRQQTTVDSGDIAVVLVNGDSATVKKVKITKDGILLIPFNSAYEPMFYSRQEVMDLPVTILGKVVELRAKF